MLRIRNTVIRLIHEGDIEFLLSLRLNNNLNKYLNHIDSDRNKQLEWLLHYKQREAAGNDYYFVISDKYVGDIGFVRVYDINSDDKTFTWGSWIIKEENRPKYAAIESALLVYEFAFLELDLSLARFVVNNNNIKVIQFHNRFGAKFKFLDEMNHTFELPKSVYIQLKYSIYHSFFID